MPHLGGTRCVLAVRDLAAIAGPVDEPWGMREFGIRTPDGHRIRFGEPLTRA